MSTDQYKPMYYGPVSQSVGLHSKKTLCTSRREVENISYKVSGNVQVMHCRRQTCLMASLLHWNNLLDPALTCTVTTVSSHIMGCTRYEPEPKRERHFYIYSVITAVELPRICTVTWFLFSLLPIALYLMWEQAGSSIESNSNFKCYFLMLGQTRRSSGTVPVTRH
jgi:hypothetical protein